MRVMSTIRRPENGTATANAALPTLAEQAYQALREGILRGQLPPGTPLSRRRLARDLGMSVPPGGPTPCSGCRRPA